MATHRLASMVLGLVLACGLLAARSQSAAPVPAAKGGPPEVRTLRGGLGYSAVAYSPDGKWLAAAAGTAVIKVWDAKTGKFHATLPVGHTGSIYSIAFSPDSSLLASGTRGTGLGGVRWGQSEDDTVSVWDLKNGKVTATLDGKKGVSKLVFGEGGKTLVGWVSGAAGSGETGVRVWDMATGKVLHTFTDCHTFAVSHDRRTLASRDLRVNGDLRAGKPEVAIRLWDLRSGKLKQTLTAEYSGNSGFYAFSPDDKLLAHVGGGGPGGRAVQLWDVADGRVKSSALLRGVDGAWATPNGEAIHFSPDGKLLAVPTLIGSLRDKDGNAPPRIARVLLLDVEKGKVVAETPDLETEIASIAFHPDGKTLAIAARGGPVRLWDVAGSRLLDSPEDSPTRFAGLLHSLAFSPNGKLLAAGHGRYADVVTVCEAANGKEVAVLQLQDVVIDSGPGRGLAFTLDSKTLVTRGKITPGKGAPFGGKQPAIPAEANRATLWDVSRAKEKAVLVGERVDRFGNPDTFVVSPDGKTLFAGCWRVIPPQWKLGGKVEDNQYRLDHAIWSLDLSGSGGTGKRLAVGPSYPTTSQASVPEPYVALAVSPDGKTLAFQGKDKFVTLWDVAAEKEQATLEGHGGTVRAVAFSTDGKVLASAGKDKTIRLWDRAARKQLAVLGGHEKAVNVVAFSPDGRTLASAADDGTVRLWDVATGKEVSVVRGHIAPVHCLAYHPDGKTLATGGRDSTIRIWDVSFRAE